MELREVVSSNVKRVGKDGDDIIVEYMKGTQYRYKGAAKLWEDLEKAESKGRFIATKIKGAFDYEKI